MSGIGVLRSGRQEARLADTPAEVEAAQRLRYRVFYTERGAQPTAEMAESGRDFDPFDDICDHMLVINRDLGEGIEGLVGTYRLVRRSRIEGAGRRFYTADEYDIAPILAQPGELLELGRSCVAADHRNRSTMQMLWMGISAYVFEYGIDLMFGCASFLGTDPDAIDAPLSYLYHHHLAPEAVRPRALAERYVPMQRVPPDRLDVAAARNLVPPLIRGYIQVLGGHVGDGAVVDHQFNTTDVCVLVRTESIPEAVRRHYDRTVREGAAWPE